ncbi:MAG TPA: N-acetylmuramoyl-L-alanine amidase [Nocardioides sp.]|nr:N-acetylmuramoyl-L-alanine amidase [Nocardioides sp.]
MSSYIPEAPEKGHRLRFVTLCQQLLALAVVVAVLTPAARTVTMEVKPSEPVDIVPTDVALRAAEVPTDAVEAEVEQYALTAPEGRPAARLHAREVATKGAGEVVNSDELPVDGYGTVGVTWAPGSTVEDDAIEIEVRTRTGEEWSGWTTAEYHDEHGPDPSTAEGKRARPGTDALLVGDVDAVQVRVATEEAAPADMKIAVIDPGRAKATAKEQPAIDTADVDGTGDPATGTDGTSDGTSDGEVTEEDLELQAGVYTARPRIYSRAQWGANESIRDRSSLSYYEVHAGFVHHTVNANGYTADQVPGIIRGIYSYHVKTRGWSDIGYNFLVDRFGRIWEGRAGGVDRPVVGAHTRGYNQYSFSMSAIGNFDTARPSSAMVTAYAKLFAWKLSLHGVSASDTSQKLGSTYFPAVNGHRDAGSTACPGRYLYAMLPTIRSDARALQKAWRGKDVESNFASSRIPDLVLRRRSDGRGFISPIVNVDGRYRLSRAVDTGRSFKGLTRIWRAGDWDRDGYADVMGQRASDGALLLYRGLGRAKLAAPVVIRKYTGSWELIVPVGDVTGDGWPDLMAQPKGYRMRILPGRGLNGWRNSYPAYAGVAGGDHLAAGRWDSGDGAPDSIVRDGSKLTVYYGNGPGGWTSTRVLAQSASGYDAMIGVSSINGDWHSDVIARVGSTGQYQLLRGTPTGLASPIPIGTTRTYDLAG